MYFRKTNSTNGKHHKLPISGNIIVKLALKYSYGSNGKWGFIEMQSGKQFMEGHFS